MKRSLCAIAMVWFGAGAACATPQGGATTSVNTTAGAPDGAPLRGTRLAGPPRRYHGLIARQFDGRLRGRFQLCVGPAGSVERVEIIRSTGLPDYDRELRQSISGWRYRGFDAPLGALDCRSLDVVFRLL
jgi:outer membrane biosynthesis protein TonB